MRNITPSRWSPTDLIRRLLHLRSQIRHIDLLAERERLAQGYERVPQRVWERHSALLLHRS